MAPADFIYLAIPDRFANDDPANNKFADLRDPSADRADSFLRHSGDLTGAAQHLSCLKTLVVRAVWFTPVIENNQPLTDEGGTMRASYHGYGFTDHYNVDRRLGGNAGYKTFVQQPHVAGLKVVQDAVYNHIGNFHWFIQDLPMKAGCTSGPPTPTPATGSSPSPTRTARRRAAKSRSTTGLYSFFPPSTNRTPTWPSS